MFTDEEIDAATIAYLKARGWTDEIIAIHTTTKSEVRDRMVAALNKIDELRNGDGH